MITLTHDEMRAAAAVLDTYRASGLTSLGAVVAAMNAVNKLREQPRSDEKVEQ
ncbi:hypothetical protein I5G97_gp060 [Mycobacterium phage Curiosium]|uniref:Uncharacterized protein n=1 Tax=Mycobacterium phage Curiosium TaxID=2599859 RepID=A0A5J6TVL2_9CAUD|nr:hypothetical protein I5G97_gp060 [Mycobacterium phage Curiosium]QFG14094.1 hypothetical protein PBI_CURIOSIUM_50 [Mycobacterium phage Curiosium]